MNASTDYSLHVRELRPEDIRVEYVPASGCTEHIRIRLGFDCTIFLKPPDHLDILLDELAKQGIRALAELKLAHESQVQVSQPV